MRGLFAQAPIRSRRSSGACFIEAPGRGPRIPSRKALVSVIARLIRSEGAGSFFTVIAEAALEVALAASLSGTPSPTSRPSRSRPARSSCPQHASRATRCRSVPHGPATPGPATAPPGQSVAGKHLRVDAVQHPHRLVAGLAPARPSVASLSAAVSPMRSASPASSTVPTCNTTPPVSHDDRRRPARCRSRVRNPLRLGGPVPSTKNRISDRAGTSLVQSACRTGRTGGYCNSGLASRGQKWRARSSVGTARLVLRTWWGVSRLRSKGSLSGEILRQQLPISDD
jgi:hypothetical protein